MVTMPYVMDSKDGRGYDLFSRLLKDRIILLTGEVNDEMAASIVGQLLFLEAQDPTKDISLYIAHRYGTTQKESVYFDIYKLT